jgi:DNA-binding response OmpR family regulator
MPPTILIVDDDEQILTLVEILLRRQGYQVIKAPNPYAALDVLDKSLPDLALLDFMMPGMNGIELCERIRLHPDASKMPVLMLSAVDSEEFIRDSQRAGANGHIPKSEMHRRLLHEVHQHLTPAQTQ